MERLERAFGLLVNLSVLVGLGLLVYELKLTNDLMRLDAQAKYAESFREVVSPVVGEGELAGILAKVFASDDPELSPTENTKLIFWMADLFRAWEVEYYYHKTRGFDEEAMSRVRIPWLIMLQPTVIADRFDNNSDYLDPEFKAFVNSGRERPTD